MADSNAKANDRTVRVLWIGKSFAGNNQIVTLDVWHDHFNLLQVGLLFWYKNRNAYSLLRRTKHMYWNWLSRHLMNWRP